MQQRNIRRAGVTLVEFVVAFGLFALLISIAGASFVRSARTQRAALQLMTVNDNMGITIEQMMREIRTGYNFCTADSPLTDPIYLNTCPTGPSELQFTTAGNVVTRYRLRGNAIQKGVGVEGWDPANPVSVSCDVSDGGEFDATGGICYRNITADNVRVTKAHFESRYNNPLDPGGSRPPRIIISLQVTSADPSVEAMTGPMTIQTTVSPRCGATSCPSDM